MHLAALQKASRRERQAKRHVHPENGEVIETKGGNHSGLKAWELSTVRCLGKLPRPLG